MIDDTSATKAKRTPKTPTLLRGFKDILPEDAGYWQYLRTATVKLLEDYAYGEIQIPILEQTSLFKRTIGEHTDIVSKEMFTFQDLGGDSVTMRPEFTAGMARAYIEHGMLNRPQPVKLYSIGPAFRYDRPQAGRFRQFHQIDFEIFGNDDPVSDTEIIYVSYLLCKSLGLDVTIQVNSLGTPETRAEYIVLLKEYFKSKRRLLCDDCKKRLTKNPLRLLDCKQDDCKQLASVAPQLVDHLDEESKQHFVSVLEHLDEAQVPYELNPYIVRGLDYYSRTAFEIFAIPPQQKNLNIDPNAEEGVDILPQPPQPIAIGGGGRYDGLVELLGGRETAGIGVAFGMERLIDAMKKTGVKPPKLNQPQVYLAQLGDEAAKHAFTLFETLRSSGIRVYTNFAKQGLKNQLEYADKINVIYTVILGQKELLDGTVIIRDMENGIQEVVDLAKISDEIKKRLKNGI
jgi:histidyl-tRNA synthetase